jgi:hypothetical protein
MPRAPEPLRSACLTNTSTERPQLQAAPLTYLPIRRQGKRLVISGCVERLAPNSHHCLLGWIALENKHRFIVSLLGKYIYSHLLYPIPFLRVEIQLVHVQVQILPMNFSNPIRCQTQTATYYLYLSVPNFCLCQYSENHSSWGTSEM